MDNKKPINKPPLSTLWLCKTQTASHHPKIFKCNRKFEKRQRVTFFQVQMSKSSPLAWIKKDLTLIVGWELKNNAVIIQMICLFVSALFFVSVQGSFFALFLLLSDLIMVIRKGWVCVKGLRVPPKLFYNGSISLIRWWLIFYSTFFSFIWRVLEVLLKDY